MGCTQGGFRVVWRHLGSVFKAWRCNFGRKSMKFCRSASSLKPGPRIEISNFELWLQGVKGRSGGGLGCTQGGFWVVLRHLGSVFKAWRCNFGRKSMKFLLSSSSLKPGSRGEISNFELWLQGVKGRSGGGLGCTQGGFWMVWRHLKSVFKA